MNHLATVLAVVALVGAEPLAAQGPSTIIERVLVRVNGEIFTQSDLTQHQTDAIRAREQEQRAVPDAELLKLLTEVTPDILVDAVDELLILQRGREMGLVFSDEEFQRGLDTLKKDNNLDDAGLKQALVQEGLTLEELRRNFERAWMLQMVQGREIFPRMRITEEELRQYFNANRSAFMTPATVTLRELALLAPAVAQGQGALSNALVAATRTRIDELRKRAVAGEDFEALVKEASDSATKATGGLIGPLDTRQINPAVKVVIDALKPGDISQPLQVPRGFQILRLESRETARPQTFDSVRDEIELAIRNQRLGGEMAKLKARLRTDSVIEWKDDSLRKIYERRLAERNAMTTVSAQ